MFLARFFIPIFALAQTMPNMHTREPPMSLACAPKMCLTRIRTVDLIHYPPNGARFARYYQPYSSATALRVTAILTQTERKPQDKSVRRVEKRRRPG